MAEEQAKQGTGSGGPDRLGAVQARIEELGSLNRQTEAARTAGKRTRLGIVIIILLIFIGYGWVMYRAITNFPTTTFLAQVKDRMLNPDSGTLKDFIDMAGRVLPVYQSEIQKQFGEEWPNIRAKLQGEAETFLNTIAEKSEAKINDRLRKMGKRQEQRIGDAFPQLKDEKTREIVMTNLEKGLQGAVLDVLEVRVDRAKERLLDVHDKIMQFLPEESRDNFHQRMSKAWEQFLLYDMGGSKHIQP